MKTLLGFFRSGSSVPLARLFLMSGTAAISSTLILGLLNAGAASAAHGDALTTLMVMFLIASVVYILAQRYLFVVSTVEVEKILHAYRVRQVDRIRHCDLDVLESIGPARIIGALTRQPQVISAAAAPIILGLQSTIVVGFTLIYLAWLSVPAAVLTTVIIGLGIVISHTRMARARAELAEADAKENEVFNSITDLLSGFKEIRLNAGRSADLSAYIASISNRVSELKTNVDVRLTELYLFGQIVFYGAAAAVVFLLPGMGLVQSDTLLKTVSVILFIMGPITSAVSASSSIANAQAGCQVLLDLEKKLEAASAGARPAAEPLTSFGEIKLRGAIYQHKLPDGGGFTVGPIDISLRRGELLFISGGNGAGKSTLLKLLTALYLPQQGQLLVDGGAVDADDRERYQSLFSTVFSDFHLFQRLFGLGDVASERVEEWLSTMELTGKTELREGRFDTIKLSTGQRKRLALVVAALEDRPIYVLDEFAADQDPGFRKKFYDEILPALHKRDKTVVVVTHDERYFDRATRHLMMEDGRLVERGASHA
jgi:putative ATP-binding cassette transporter